MVFCHVGADWLHYVSHIDTFLLITLSVLIALLLIWLFFKNHARSIQRFVLKNVFSDIFKEEQKADGSGETVFLLKGIDLAADKETLSKTLNGFSLSLVMLAYVVGTMFWQLLLLEVSHSCDENDTTRVCFERIAGKLGHTILWTAVACRSEWDHPGCLLQTCCRFWSGHRCKLWSIQAFLVRL